MEHMSQVGSSSGLSHSAMDRSVSVIEDGVLVGIIGAAVVAAWFFILDIARSQIFFTPSLLGSVIFLGNNPGDRLR